jgi:hypothetical protein
VGSGERRVAEGRYKTIRSGISRRIWRLFELTDRREVQFSIDPVLFARRLKALLAEDSPVERGGRGC